MKNVNIKLTDKIPNRIRLSCYKKALAYYKKCAIIQATNPNSYDNEFPKVGNHTGFYGVCMLLPVFLWDLPSYMTNPTNEYFWQWAHTSIGFPEVKPLVDELKTYNGTMLDEINLRIKHLELIVKSFDLF